MWLWLKEELLNTMQEIDADNGVFNMNIDPEVQKDDCVRKEWESNEWKIKIISQQRCSDKTKRIM